MSLFFFLILGFGLCFAYHLSAFFSSTAYTMCKPELFFHVHAKTSLIKFLFIPNCLFSCEFCTVST